VRSSLAPAAWLVPIIFVASFVLSFVECSRRHTRCARMPGRTAQEAQKPGLKPLTRFRLKAELRQGVAGAPGLGSKADAEVGVPSSDRGRRRRRRERGCHSSLHRAPGSATEAAPDPAVPGGRRKEQSTRPYIFLRARTPDSKSSLSRDEELCPSGCQAARSEVGRCSRAVLSLRTCRDGPEETMRTLDLIERYGDRAAYQRTRQVRTWLLHGSNLESVS
jgi:hypothetical protein